MSAHTRPGRRWLILATASAMVLALGLVSPWTNAPRASAATSDQCQGTDGTPLPASCQVALAPTSLPQRTVVGEYEAGVLTRNDQSGQPVSAMDEFAAGGILGSCDPATEDCSMKPRIDLRSDPRDPSGSQPRVDVPDSGFGPAAGPTDAAATSLDVNGDGRQEVIRASTCAGSSDLCLSMFEPGEPGVANAAGYSATYSTGLSVDNSNVGRIRLAGGPIGLAATTVTGASFSLDADQQTTIATFTTAGRHGFHVGDPVRLDNDPGLQGDLCVSSPLAKDGVQCIGQDLLSYHPIASVTPTTFSVDLGVLVVTHRGVGQVVEPAPWSAGCLSCGVRAESLSTGLVVAWTAPNMSLQVATFSVAPGADQPFQMLDVRQVGRLYQGGSDAAPAREAFDLAVDDFQVGGPDEIALAWGGSCGGQALPCPKLAFLAMHDAKRLTLLSTVPWGNDPWCNDSGTPIPSPASWGPLSVTLASGHFRQDGDASSGADLAVGWVAAANPSGGQTGNVYHVFESYDVSPQLTLAPSLPLDDSAPNVDPGPCATVTASHASSTDDSAVRSQMQVATGDFDGQRGDELVVAETLPSGENTPGGAPVGVSLWSQGAGGQDGPGWRVQDHRQASVTGWSQPYLNSPAAYPAGLSGYAAIGGGGSGQVSLAVGRLARRQTSSTQDTAYPNAVNPDVLVGWTCDGPASCGGTTSSDSDVAIDTLGVSVDPSGSSTFAHESSATTSVRPAKVPPDTPYTPGIQDRTFVQVVPADLNGDSSTLGDPVRSFSVGEVQPLMIVRAPPVEFAPFDGSHPGYGKDGWISSAEVEDLSGCYASNGADTDAGDCPMRTTYQTSGGTDSSIAVSVQNSWGVNASTSLGGSVGVHDDQGSCMDPVCWEASVELAYAHQEQQQSQAQRSKSFDYTAEQVVAPMQDRAFVATSDIEMDQVPVYFGTFSGGALPASPDLWTYSATPLDTVFSWVATNDPQYGSTFAGIAPGNVLSYPATRSQIQTRALSVVRVHRESSSTLVVDTASNHGYLCTLPSDQVETSFPSSVGSECAGQQEPVRLRGAGAFDGTDYVVSGIRSPTEVVLEKTGSQVPVGVDACTTGTCTLSRQPSQLPVQTQEIGPGTQGSVSYTFGQVEGYQEQYAVTNGASAEISSKLTTEGDAFTWEAHVKGDFEHSDESMMNMVLQSATAWTFDYGGTERPGTYRVTPYLADDPATGALTLTWTAAPVGSSGLWGNPVYGYGAAGDPDLPARPDPAFSLPMLYEPYRVHSGEDDNLDVLMASPDFQTWNCDDAHVCRPQEALKVGRPMELTAVVHNFSLADLPASPARPVTVRFYLGDPARGGYAIAQADVTQPIPLRDQTVVKASWTPPAALAGEPPQAIYAVIDPQNTVDDEVFDWRSPVVLWNRQLKGQVVSARSQVLDGSRSFVFTTDVDHGLAIGDPVTVRHVGHYKVVGGQVTATTPTTFAVAATSKLPPSVEKAGAWTSTQDASCMTNNPWYGNSTKDYYSFGGWHEFQSSCPTTNNEGYFLTPRIQGNRASVPKSDLSVGRGSVRVSKNGRAVSFDLRSTKALYGRHVLSRVWICATPRTSCTPQVADLERVGSTGAVGARYEARSGLTVAAGGRTRVRVPLTGTALRKGAYRIGVQVIPLDVWERPGGPGLYQQAMGQLANDQVVSAVRVR